jgi:hypothetical protein
MQNISIGLVGNNLALWTKFQTLTETQAISGGTLLPGFSAQLPSSRNYGSN